MHTNCMHACVVWTKLRVTAKCVSPYKRFNVFSLQAVFKHAEQDTINLINLYLLLCQEHRDGIVDGRGHWRIIKTNEKQNEKPHILGYVPAPFLRQCIYVTVLYSLRMPLLNGRSENNGVLESSNVSACHLWHCNDVTSSFIQPFQGNVNRKWKQIANTN